MPDGVVWPAAEPARSWLNPSPEVRRALDIAVKVAGLLVATLLGAALAIIEVLYSPLRIDGWRVPVSLLIALATNPLLGWFAYTTTRRQMAALAPAAAWCVVWVLAAARTSEGDLLISQDNWVGLLTLFAGSIEFAVGIYISTLRSRPAPPASAGT